MEIFGDEETEKHEQPWRCCWGCWYPHKLLCGVREEGKQWKFNSVSWFKEGSQSCSENLQAGGSLVVRDAYFFLSYEKAFPAMPSSHTWTLNWPIYLCWKLNVKIPLVPVLLFLLHIVGRVKGHFSSQCKNRQGLMLVISLIYSKTEIVPLDFHLQTEMSYF